MRTEHRFNRGGDRQLNHALHIIAITCALYDPVSRAYIDRKLAEGKTKRAAMRGLNLGVCESSPRPEVALAESTPSWHAHHVL